LVVAVHPDEITPFGGTTQYQSQACVLPSGSLTITCCRHQANAPEARAATTKTMSVNTPAGVFRVIPVLPILDCKKNALAN
jgi:hypothetical protein